MKKIILSGCLAFAVIAAVLVVVLPGIPISSGPSSEKGTPGNREKNSQKEPEGLNSKEYFFEDGDGNQYIYTVIDSEDKTICLHHIVTEQSEFTIPAQIDGWQVIRVGQFYPGEVEEPAVDKNHSIRSLAFSPGIKDIGERAFEEDRETAGVLKEVDLGTVGRIGVGAFAHSALTKLTLPESVYEVGDWAFSDCEELKKVTVMNPAVELKDLTFSSCGIVDLELPKRMTGKIGHDCFSGIAVRTLRWPEFSKEDAKNIAMGAFSHCEKLSRVIFSENQEHIYIEDAVFAECKKLTGLTFPKTTGKVTYGTNLYADNYRHSCKTLTITGKDTKLKGIKTGNEKYELLTVGEVIAPAGSKAEKYAKRAKRIAKIGKRILEDKEWGGGCDFSPEYYMEKGDVIYGKMRVRRTKE